MNPLKNVQYYEKRAPKLKKKDMDILESLLVETAIQGLELTGFEMAIQRQETSQKKTPSSPS